MIEDREPLESEPGRIEALATLREDVPPELRQRVQNSIHRRILTADLVDLSWFAPLAVVIEFLGAIFGRLTAASKGETGDDEHR